MRHFKLSDAEQLLPELEASLRQAMEVRHLYDEAEEQLTAYRRHLSFAGGVRVDPEAAIDLKSRRETAAVMLRQAIESVQRSGCQLKDLNNGLVDFPTFYRGREVLLCWKLGEPRIEYWHDLEAGFAGRQRIDDDFLKKHTGDKAH